MGYTTYFTGAFKLSRKLSDAEKEYLIKFNETRRMARRLDPIYGVEGEFYVDGGGDCGQAEEDNIIDYNRPPKTQPGLWCGWRPSECGEYITWDGAEKFYSYVKWLNYIITKFLEPAGIKLNGIVNWRGEISSDKGCIIVKNNVITTQSEQLVATHQDIEACGWSDDEDVIPKKIGVPPFLMSV
jgi:hypothetical protein